MDGEGGAGRTGPGRLARWGARELAGGRSAPPGRYVACAYADWCPFCTEFLELFHRWEPPSGWQRIGIALTDLQNPLWELLAVEVVPTLLGFTEGKLAWRIDGVYGEGLSDRDLERAGANASGRGRGD